MSLFLGDAYGRIYGETAIHGVYNLFSNELAKKKKHIERKQMLQHVDNCWF